MTDTGLGDYNKLKDRLKERLASKLSPAIFQHSLRVAKEAHQLAKGDETLQTKAYLAGLLHDYCRNWSRSSLKAVLENSRWQLDCWEKKLLSLWHAPAAATVAENKFSISDEDILKAIRFHTIAALERKKLGDIIYLADKIEPGRDYPGIEKIRREARDDLKKALLHQLDNTIDYLLASRAVIHPNTIIVRNKLLGGWQ